ARAGAVVDDHLLAPGVGEPRGEKPCDDVGAAARREGHDDAHRLGGELGQGRRRDQRERKSEILHFDTISCTCLAPAVDSARRNDRWVPVGTYRAPIFTNPAASVGRVARPPTPTCLPCFLHAARVRSYASRTRPCSYWPASPMSARRSFVPMSTMSTPSTA